MNIRVQCWKEKKTVNLSKNFFASLLQGITFFRAYFCDLKNKHRRLTLFLFFSKFIHPASLVIFFHHCTSSFCLSPQATMTKKKIRTSFIVGCSKFCNAVVVVGDPSEPNSWGNIRNIWSRLSLMALPRPEFAETTWQWDHWVQNKYEFMTFSPFHLKSCDYKTKGTILTCCDSVQKLMLFCSFAPITTLSYCSVFAFQNSQVDFKALY